MINPEILGGLKSAMLRGESVKQAMISFYNAGYKKQDIEDSAKTLLQLQQPVQQPVQQAQPVNEKYPKYIPAKPVQQPVKISQKVSNYGIPRTKKQPKKIIQKPKPVSQPQKVSNYGTPPTKPKGKIAILILVFLLLFLLGILVSVFFFKEELIDFFNKLFS